MGTCARVLCVVAVLSGMARADVMYDGDGTAIPPFDVVAGDRLVIDDQASGGTPALKADIAGDRLEATGSAKTQRVQLESVAPITGRVTLAVTSNGTPGVTVKHRVRIERLRTPARPIAIGTELEIENPAYGYHFIRFEGVAGQRVAVDVDTIAGDEPPSMMVSEMYRETLPDTTDANGTITQHWVEHSSCATCARWDLIGARKRPAHLEIVLPVSGRYNIMVLSLESAKYRVRISSDRFVRAGSRRVVGATVSAGGTYNERGVGGDVGIDLFAGPIDVSLRGGYAAVVDYPIGKPGQFNFASGYHGFEITALVGIPLSLRATREATTAKTVRGCLEQSQRDPTSCEKASVDVDFGSPAPALARGWIAFAGARVTEGGFSPARVTSAVLALRWYWPQDYLRGIGWLPKSYVELGVTHAVAGRDRAYLGDSAAVPGWYLDVEASIGVRLGMTFGMTGLQSVGPMGERASEVYFRVGASVPFDVF